MTQTNAIERLIRAGLTRGEIATAVGSSRAAVSHWETGRSVPSAKMLGALVKLASERGVVLLASDFVTAPPLDSAA